MELLPSCETASRCSDSRGGVRITKCFQTTNNAKENVFLPFHAKEFNIYTADTQTYVGLQYKGNTMLSFLEIIFSLTIMRTHCYRRHTFEWKCIRLQG